MFFRSQWAGPLKFAPEERGSGMCLALGYGWFSACRRWGGTCNLLAHCTQCTVEGATRLSGSGVFSAGAGRCNAVSAFPTSAGADLSVKSSELKPPTKQSVSYAISRCWCPRSSQEPAQGKFVLTVCFFVKLHRFELLKACFSSYTDELCSIRPSS